MDAKFCQADREISLGSSTKLRGELSSSFREIKGQNPANFASFFLIQYCVIARRRMPHSR